MELYIHFGIYKAGSSFIQYSCAINRLFLMDRGYFFPKSHYQTKMEKGLISPGNAGKLVDYLKSSNVSKTTGLINQWKKLANERKLKKILISAEALVHPLATLHGLSTLERAAQAAGITHIHALGYFRDLVDHALSTYKHRAKTGRIPDFEKWLLEVYETPRVLDSFFNNHSKSSIQWTFRKFQKDSNYLLEKFYGDWLATELPAPVAKPKVNESVTFSEILIMNRLAKIYPEVIDFFVDSFKLLESKEKGNDRLLEQQFYRKAYYVLSVHENLLRRVNEKFEPKDQIKLGEEPVISTDERKEIILSERQIEVLGSILSLFNKPKGRLILAKRSFVKLIPRSVRNNFLSFKRKLLG